MSRTLVLCLSAVLVLPSSTAQVTWRTVHGGNGADEAACVRTTADGGSIVAGSTSSFGAGGGDVYLIKLDPDGQREWSATFGGTGVDRAHAVRQLPDGGFVLAGVTTSSGAGGYDGYMVRTDAQGSAVWERTYGGPDWDFLYSVELLPSGDLLLAGDTYSMGAGGSDGWLLLVNGQGDVIWENTYGGPGEEGLRDAIPVSTGGFAAAGTAPSGGFPDAWVLRLDDAGVEQWSSLQGGDSLDVAEDILETLDGGFSIVGRTRSFNVFVEQYHYKLDASGTFQWEWNWGQTGDQEGFEHVELPDGRFASMGYNRAVGAGGADLFLLITQPDGWFITGRSYGEAADDLGASLDVTSDGGFVLAGSTENWGGGPRSVIVIRTDSAGATASEVVQVQFDPLNVRELASRASLQVWPTLVAPNGTVEVIRPGGVGALVLRDMLGREHLLMNTGQERVTIDLSSQPLQSAGMLMLCSQNAEGLLVSRIMLAGP